MNKEKKNLLVFGYGLALIISFFVIRHGMKTGGLGLVSWLLIGIAGAFLIITTADYRRLKPVYTKWMVVTRIIGAVMKTVILTFLYYFIFGLVGVMLRLLRKDLLDRRIEPDKQSYWIQRKMEPFDKSSCERQF